MLVPKDQPGADGTSWLSVEAVWSLCCRAVPKCVPTRLGVQVHGSYSPNRTNYSVNRTCYHTRHLGFISTLYKVARRGFGHQPCPPSKIGTGFPRAPASGCPSEVVRDQTRDKLGKDKEEIPQPLYLFVSLSAIFAYVMVYKVLHDIWSYWLGSLGEIFKGIGALLHPSPVVGQGLIPVCAFTPPLASALLLSRSPRAGTGGLCSPQPLSQLVRAMLVLHLELSPEHHASEHQCRAGSRR